MGVMMEISEINKLIDTYQEFLRENRNYIFRKYKERFIFFPFKDEYHDIESLCYYAHDYFKDYDKYIDRIYIIKQDYYQELETNPVIKYLIECIVQLELMKPVTITINKEDLPEGVKLYV